MTSPLSKSLKLYWIISLIHRNAYTVLNIVTISYHPSKCEQMPTLQARWTTVCGWRLHYFSKWSPYQAQWQNMLKSVDIKLKWHRLNQPSTMQDRYPLRNIQCVRIRQPHADMYWNRPGATARAICHQGLSPTDEIVTLWKWEHKSLFRRWINWTNINRKQCYWLVRLYCATQALLHQCWNILALPSTPAT